MLTKAGKDWVRVRLNAKLPVNVSPGGSLIVRCMNYVNLYYTVIKC